ncbi:MAG: FHA domain-containing protein [Burkholderiales bacterium]|nr:FHA domain-containing protein [Burkholderiales bacterium]
MFGPLSANHAVASRIALHAQITGSDTMFRALGESRAQALLQRTAQRLGHGLAASGGLVIGARPSDLVALFEHADQAVQAACGLRCALQEWLQPVLQDIALDLDVGLSAGLVLCHPPVYEGQTLQHAAALANAASDGQILLDQTVRAQLCAALQNRLHPLRFDDGGQIWRLVCPQAMPSPTSVPTVTLVDHQSGLPHAYASGQAILLGRASDSTIVVDHQTASRRHAVIAWKGYGYILTDMSRHGTWIAYGDGHTAMCVRQNIALLQGEGTLYLGRASRPPGRGDVTFRIVPPRFCLASDTPDTAAAVQP